MIYIDNNATTKIDEEVLDAMKPYLRLYYGNPGSKYYDLGAESKKAIEIARENVANLINARPDEILFTSSGSEANNFIIKGVTDYLKNYEGKGNHIMTSKVEHKSVLNAFRYLNGEIFMNTETDKKVDRGFDVDFLDVNKYAQVEVEDLASRIKDTSIFGSFIWGNNEIGNLNPIKEITELFNEKNIYIHSDATQIIGKIPVDMEINKLDSITFSAHKLNGPKGVGAAYIRKQGKDKQNITSLIHGGADQESGYRAGTAAVHDIVGFGKAAEIALRDMKNHIENLLELEDEFIKIIKANFPDAIIFNDMENKIPGTVSFATPNIDNEELLSKIGDRVAFSAGSACSSSSKTNSLDYIGMGKYKSNVYRVGLGKYNTSEEIKMIDKCFKELGL